jgi:hypothetical protein
MGKTSREKLGGEAGVSFGEVAWMARSQDNKRNTIAVRRSWLINPNGIEAAP